MFHRLLTPWFAEFPREQILVRLFEDFRADPEAIVRAAWMRTWGLRAALAPHLPLILRGRLYPFVAGLKRTTGSKTPLDPSLRARLTREMEDEIRGVEKLLDRDLGAWRA